MEDSTYTFRDWYCRNCKFWFVPTFWVPAGIGAGLVGQCSRCGSNATQPASTVVVEVDAQGTGGVLAGEPGADKRAVNTEIAKLEEGKDTANGAGTASCG